MKVNYLVGGVRETVQLMDSILGTTYGALSEPGVSEHWVGCGQTSALPPKVAFLII